MKRVTVGRKYQYQPVGLDIYDARTNLRAGDIVEVINVHGCPANGVMGHCYVKSEMRGMDLGLVLVASLQPVPQFKKMAKLSSYNVYFNDNCKDHFREYQFMDCSDNWAQVCKWLDVKSLSDVKYCVVKCHNRKNDIVAWTTK